MHYHLEIVMPPTHDVKDAVGKILAPFDENGEGGKYTFWDWWVIGGRWSGAKREAKFPKDKMEAFQQWLKDEGTTVSDVQLGKPSLSPSSQISKVDAKWQEMFSVTGPCTLFAHSNVETEVLSDDVCLLKEVGPVTASRVIIAGPSYDGDIEACYMIEQEYWNGVTHIQSIWDGTVAEALTLWGKRMNGYKEEWRETHTPKDDWLVVTVDYHS